MLFSQKPNIKTMNHNSLLILWCFLLLLCTLSVEAQKAEDMERVKTNNQLALDELRQKNYKKALFYGEEALAVADKVAYQNGKAESLYTIGRIYGEQNNLSVALNYYLQSSILFERNNNKEGFAKTYLEAGNLYTLWRNPQKALDNYQKALSTVREVKTDHSLESQILTGIGNAYQQLEDYPNAIKTYESLLEIYKKQDNKTNVAGTLGKLSFVSKTANQLDQALEYANQKYQIYDNIGDKLNTAYAANNLGYLHRQKGNNDKAIESFSKALELFKGLNNKAAPNAVTLHNIGVAQTNLGNFKQAETYFNQALKINETLNKPNEVVNSYNYIAANDYISGNNEKALASVQKGIEIGEAYNVTNELLEAYQIQSEIYARMGDFKKSQDALKKQQTLKDQITQEDDKQKEALRKAQLEAEKTEGEIKLLIKDKEKQEAELREKEQALKVQQQQLELIKKEKDLQAQTLENQRLEQQRAVQALALAQQQLEAEKRNKAISDLQKQKEIQDLAFKQKELEEQKQKEAFKLLETEKKAKEQEIKAQEEKLKDEAKLRQYTNYIFLLVAIVAAIVGYAYYSQQKANRRLKEQQEEIKQKNEELMTTEEELRQNMEELQTTQEAMAQRQKDLEVANKKMASNEQVLRKSYQKLKENETLIREQNESLILSQAELRKSMEELQNSRTIVEEQKRELELQNLRTTQSIQYALTIQNAILPTPSQQAAIFPESFIIYKPKDIVSGDFYWFSKHGNKNIVAVLDCTGHGVPGAFMSLIGNTLLNEAINQLDIYDPALILNHLHKGVRKRLNQDEGANNDGMDVGVCLLEPAADGTVTFTYAGAKHKIFVFTSGTIQELRSGRKSIGGWQHADEDTQKEFFNQVMPLAKGDMIYLFTDGYIDQASADRVRFGTPKLKDLLTNIQGKYILEQKNILVEALKQHQTTAEQRDDITFIGIRV